MTPKEHAEVWRRAAEVVGGMDTLTAEINAHSSMGMRTGTWTSRAYSAEEMAMNRAYSAAAAVLYKIAHEYEKSVTADEEQG